MSRHIMRVRSGLFAATAVSAIFAATSAHAQDAPGASEQAPEIVIRNDLNPNTTPPSGIVDTGINGIGQVITDSGGGSVGLCTASLINARTVIFAAHCVNTRAASAYGGNTGGTGISVNFNDNTLASLRRWLGLDGGTKYATDVSLNSYNINQVWYDPRSKEPASCVSATSCFLQADIAIGTLDTPATNIPTWAMLFTPLSGPTHGVITGYGNRGNSNSASLGVDWRRRSAENMISFLGSLDDIDNFLFGPGNTANPQNLYQTSFNDPNPGYNPTTAARKFDFGIFGGSALPLEGTTAPGDSGGPLIADQAYDRAVVVGVLSGSSRFFTPQRSWEYGTTSFYQPLYLYWETIVANNPYVYAGSRAGSRFWDDPNHWVQLMDPSYMIDVNGQLVNGLPNFREDGTAGNGPKFGSVCFLTDCEDVSGAGTPLTSGSVIVPGGPGSTNFVPNNVTPNPGLGIRARYYDVSLNAAGTTTLRTQVEVDVLNMNNPLAALDINSQGQLTVLGDYNQWRGSTNVDGRLNTGDMLAFSGFLTGRGTINPTYLTLGPVFVAPAGDAIGTLTVQGDVIFTSATFLNVQLSGTQSDRLAVTGDASNPGIAALAGSVVFSAGPGAAPRHNQTYTFITAQGGVDGRFDVTGHLLGLLSPQVTYNANNVTVRLQAGSILDYIAGLNGNAQAIARVLDGLRANNYAQLSSLYGAIDVMSPQALASTLNRLTPTDSMSETRRLQDRQSRLLLNNVTDRLSMLGNVPGGTMSFSTDSGLLATAQGQSAPTLGFHSIVPSRAGVRTLPANMTGFVSSGYSAAGSTLGSDRTGTFGGQQTWHVSMGLEMESAPGFVLGTAFGYSDGFSRPGAEARSETRTSQVAVYGSYQLGGGAYVGGVASADMSRFNLARDVTLGVAPVNVTGATSSSRMSARVETGVNLRMGGLMLTPRVALAYSSFSLDGFREQGGEAALQFDELGMQTLETRAGMQLAGQRQLSGGWRFVPQLQADVVRVLAGADNGMSVRFAAAPDLAFALPLAGGDSTWGEVRGGFRLTNGPLELGAGLETTVARTSFRDDRAVADVTFRF